VKCVHSTIYFINYIRQRKGIVVPRLLMKMVDTGPNRARAISADVDQCPDNYRNIHLQCRASNVSAKQQ
jgi:hypothetical protein